MDFYLLVLLICTTPALLMIDSPIAGGAISAILAIALAFSARTIRPGQADHFFVLARPIVFVVAIPAVWILVQILPLGFSGPIQSDLGERLGRNWAPNARPDQH